MIYKNFKNNRTNMTSLMQQLITDVTTSVTQQITDKWLPIIADKYDIPLAELTTLVNSVTGNTGKIKAVAKAAGKPTGTAAQGGVKKATPKGSLADLQKKITSAQAQGKYLNVLTKRPVADIPANRKKMVFYDELGIAGPADDPKLKETLQMLLPKKKEVPVHKQAATARKKAAIPSDQDSGSDAAENPSDEDKDAPSASEGESTSELEITAPADSDNGSDNGSDSGSKKKLPQKIVAKSKIVKQAVAKSSGEKMQKKKKPVMQESEASVDEASGGESSESGGEIKKQVKKKIGNVVKTAAAANKNIANKNGAKKRLARKVSKTSVSKPPVSKTSNSSQASQTSQASRTSEKTDDMKAVLKFKQMIEESGSEDSGSESPPVQKKKGPALAFTKSIRKWVNLEHQFVADRAGAGITFVGKLVNDKVVPLTAADVKVCKANGWNYKIVPVKKAESGSDNDSDGGSESE